MKKLVAAVLMMVGCTHVHAQANIAGTLYASNFARWTVAPGTNGPFSWSSQQVCTAANSGGVTFQPFKVGTPVRIVDTASPANSETVVPSAVNINGSGCSITVQPSIQHYSYYIASATAGLQESINYANSATAVVILTPDWVALGGTTAMLSAALGNANVSILDERNAIIVPYTWNGTAYVAHSFGGGGTPGGIPGDVQANIAGVFGPSGLKTISSQTLLQAVVPFGFGASNSTQPYGGDQQTNQFNCWQSLVAGVGTTGHNCLTLTDTALEFGLNNGNGFGNTNGWTVHHSLNLTGNYYTPGISQGQVLQCNKYSFGDSSCQYIYHQHGGGFLAPSDEGQVAGSFNISEFIYPYISTTTSVGTGLTQLVSGSTTYTPLVGSSLIDTSRTVSAGYITTTNAASGGYPATIVTSNTHTLSAAWGITQAAINISNNGASGSVATVNVRVDGGTNAGGFTTGAVIWFGCDNFLDQVTPTAVSALSGGTQNITGSFLHAHATNCAVYQGGEMASLDLHGDRRVEGSYYLRTDYIILGCRTTTACDYRSYITGQQGGFTPYLHNFGTTISSIGILTRASNVVTACNYYDPQLQGRTITISGAPDTTYNGTFSNVGLVYSGGKSCLTWNNSGTDGTTLNPNLTWGGTLDDLGGYTMWPVFEVRSLDTAQYVDPATGVTSYYYTGKINVAPNSVTVANGDNIEGLHSMASKSTGIFVQGVMHTPPTSANQDFVNIGASGEGVTASNFHMLNLYNGNDWSKYNGYGASGHLQPITGIEMQGPFGYLLRSYMPTEGGYGIYFDHPAYLSAGVWDPLNSDYEALHGEGRLGYFKLGFNAYTSNLWLGIGTTTSGWNFDPTAGISTTAALATAAITSTGQVQATSFKSTGSSGQVLATGIIDGLTPITITTGATASLGATGGACGTAACLSGYTLNAETTPATAVAYTLPVAAAGKQYCVRNYTGSTGALTLQTSAAGQYIDVNGANTASGGYVVSAGALGDAACAVGIDATHWALFVQGGTWTVH